MLIGRCCNRHSVTKLLQIKVLLRPLLRVGPSNFLSNLPFTRSPTIRVGRGLSVQLGSYRIYRRQLIATPSLDGVRTRSTRVHNVRRNSQARWIIVQYTTDRAFLIRDDWFSTIRSTCRSLGAYRCLAPWLGVFAGRPIVVNTLLQTCARSRIPLPCRTPYRAKV